MSESRVRWSEIRRLGADGVEDDEERFAAGRYFDCGCLAGDLVGYMVYITGSSFGTLQVATALPGDAAKMPAVGMLVSKSAPTVGLVQIKGVVSPAGQVFVAKTIYYIGLTGIPASSPPTLGLKQLIGQGLESGKLLLEPNFLLRSSTEAGTRKHTALSGLQDGINRTFLTPDKFVHLSATSETVAVYHNGRRLVQTAGSNPDFGDFFVSESGAPGTGYDTVNLLTFSPTTNSVLRADYLAA